MWDEFFSLPFGAMVGDRLEIGGEKGREGYKLGGREDGKERIERGKRRTERWKRRTERWKRRGRKRERERSHETSRRPDDDERFIEKTFHGKKSKEGWRC